MGNVRMRAEQINYGATNVKKALDDLDPMDLIALSGRMDTIEAWKATVKTEEKTGADVTFTNALALAAVSLSAEIETIQDLHGYDKPWVGGAYKNKLPMTVSTIKAANTDGSWSGNVYTYRGVTFTLNDDGDGNLTSIVANGNATEGSVFLYLTGVNLISHLLPEGTFILSDNVNTSAITSGSIYVSVEERLNGGNVNYLANTNNSGRASSAFTIDYSQYNEFRALIYAPKETVVNNAVFYPMIRLATETDASFAPYSNICPISGRTAVTITDVDAESQTATVTVQLGQTVYGGSLNVTTGVLTVTHELITLDGSSDETWAKSSITACDIFRYANTDYRFISGTLTNMYPFVNEYDYNQIGYTWKSVYSGVTDAELRVGFSAYNTTTLEQFKAWLASNNLQVYAQLATPQTIQLTPEQLTMLKGYNRLSADTGDITVEAYTGAAWGGDEA